MSPTDQVRLRHMLEAAQKVQQFTRNSTRKDLDTDEKLSLAIVRLLEICGEAAKAVSLPIKDANSQVPWSQIGRTRDRLILANCGRGHPSPHQRSPENFGWIVSADRGVAKSKRGTTRLTTSRGAVPLHRFCVTSACEPR